jgi:hypothetical protein
MPSCARLAANSLQLISGGILQNRGPFVMVDFSRRIRGIDLLGNLE